MIGHSVPDTCIISYVLHYADINLYIVHCQKGVVLVLYSYEASNLHPTTPTVSSCLHEHIPSTHCQYLRTTYNWPLHCTWHTLSHILTESRFYVLITDFDLARFFFASTISTFILSSPSALNSSNSCIKLVLALLWPYPVSYTHLTLPTIYSV